MEGRRAPRRFGKSNINIFPVGFGCWAIGGRHWGPVDDDESKRAIRQAVESGINFFDTADVYGFGHSEELLGGTIGGREDVIIATKVGLRWNNKGKIKHDLSPDYLRRACEASLKRLRCETLDLYQLHWPDPQTPLAETIEALEALVQAGMVRYVGAGNLGVTALEKLKTCSWFVSYQGLFNYFDRAAQAETMLWCRQNDIAFIAYEPLAKGLLTGKFTGSPVFNRGDHRKHEERFATGINKFEPELETIRGMAVKQGLTPAQWALAWALDAGADMVIPGMKTVAQVAENARAGRA